MTLADAALIISIVAAGLFSGLMFSLVVALQPMWQPMEFREYAASMQAFLPAAKGHPIITALTLLPFLLPIVALATFAGGAAPARFGLTLAGALLGLGPLIVTLRLNFPIYDAVMAWQPEETPSGWQQIRRRFYTLNLVRMSLMLGAMVSFLLALSLGGG